MQLVIGQRLDKSRVSELDDETLAYRPPDDPRRVITLPNQWRDVPGHWSSFSRLFDQVLTPPDTIPQGLVDKELPDIKSIDDFSPFVDTVTVTSNLYDEVGGYIVGIKPHDTEGIKPIDIAKLGTLIEHFPRIKAQIEQYLAQRNLPHDDIRLYVFPQVMI